MTTGGFSSRLLLNEESILKLPSLTNSDSVEIGDIAITLGNQPKLPITIEVQSLKMIGGLIVKLVW
jgi:hypothetical protein